MEAGAASELRSFFIHTSGLFLLNKVVKVNHAAPSASPRGYPSPRRTPSSPCRQPLDLEGKEVGPRPVTAHAPGRGPASQRRGDRESSSGVPLAGARAPAVAALIARSRGAPWDSCGLTG